MNTKLRIVLGLPVLLILLGASGADDRSARAQDEEAIWKLEQSLYSGPTGRSNLASYLNAMDADYAGWPPQAAAPLGYEHIAQAAARATGRASVELKMHKDLVRVRREGTVALAFYTTRRTLRAGAAVDESFETLHVWIKGEDGAWKLFGAMVRPAPVRDAKP